MAVLKVACPKCGQKVSGDESFYGTSVDCPICTSIIRFPEAPEGKSPPTPATASPTSAAPESPPQAQQAPPAAASHAAAELKRETSAIPLPPNHGAAHTPDPGGGEVPSPVLGVVSMVLGIVSVMFFCLPGILLGPTAIICGHFARSRARHSSVRPAPGNGAALTGLILGYLSLAGFILIVMFIGDFMEWLRSTKAPD